MSRTVQPPGPPILVDLLAPAPALTFGPFSVDPIRLLIGASLGDLLAPLMRAPVGRRGNLDVYPLALPDGEGISIPVKGWGSLGFRNLGGIFVVIVPSVIAGQVGAALAPTIARGDAAPRFDPSSNGQTAEWGIRTRPGMRFPICSSPVEIALETPR